MYFFFYFEINYQVICLTHSTKKDIYECGHAYSDYSKMKEYFDNKLNNKNYFLKH